MGATVSTEAAKEVTGSQTSLSAGDSPTSTHRKCPVQHGRGGADNKWTRRDKQQLVPGTWIEECLSDAGKCPVTAAKQSPHEDESVDPTNMVRISGEEWRMTRK